jgi:hypothetical protein
MDSSKRMPTESEFIDWLAHPATQALHRYLRAWSEDNKQNWARGDYMDESAFKTTAMNIASVAQCKMADLIVDLDYHELIGEIEDGKSERPETTGESGASEV